MSDGLRVIAAAIAAGSAGILMPMQVGMFQGDEVTALNFVRGYFRQYRELPESRTVQEETGVRLPVSNEALNFYVDRIYERHEYNQIRDRFAALRDGLSSMDMAAVGDAVTEMHRVTRTRNRRGLESMDIREAMGLVDERLDRTRGYGGITGVETGWAGYDHITGGYQDGDLISVVGRMGLGKTYIALKQAEYCHTQGESVLFVTTEMGIEQLGRRHASIALGINPMALKNNTISTHMQRRMRSYYREMVGTDRFRIFSVGMNSQVSSLEAFMQEYSPSIVFIDGVYLLKPTQQSRNMNRGDRITAVYDELKALTLEANVPMVATTQFNRTAGKGGKEGSLENIGYSDAIGTHSSIVVALKYGPTMNPKHSRYLEFLKGREGEDGQVAINFKFAPLDMAEFTPEQRAAQAETEASTTDVNWMA